MQFPMQPLIAVSRARVALRASSITKVFGSTVALWDVDLTCGSGELLALHGANGSGKSTLLRILAGLMTPTRGRVSIAAEAGDRPRLGFLGHATHLFDQLTALENVSLAARLARRDDALAVGLLEELGVAPVAGHRVLTLSAGTRRRVALARLLATDPHIVLLDEPLAGLDADAADLVVRLLIQERVAGRLIVAATHDEARSGLMATRLARLEQGRLREASDALLRSTL